jgi:hypothetical protein
MSERTPMIEEECQECEISVEPCAKHRKAIHQSWHERGMGWIRAEECDETCPAHQVAPAAGKKPSEQSLETGDALADWFELSYAQFLTVPRLVLQSMPMEWQIKMAALLREMDETFDWRPKEGRYWVRLKDAGGRFSAAPLDDYRHGNIEHLRRSAEEGTFDAMLRHTASQALGVDPSHIQIVPPASKEKQELE